MTKILLLSDSHSYIDDRILEYAKQADEIWHCGDFGSMDVIEQLEKIKPLKGVYGNIDGYDVRSIYPEKLVWYCEAVKVYMTHIGGYPSRYAPGVMQQLINEGAKLFISGHSHILKVIYDDKINCLHMNPGAAGKQGWHKVRTVLRFTIDGADIRDCEVIELGSR